MRGKMIAILTAIVALVASFGLLGLRGPRAPRAKTVFTKTLDHADLWDSALETAANYITCTAAIWTVVGRYKVKAQQLVRVGYGSPAFPDNQGYMYFALYDDTATNSVLEEGKIRIVQRDSEGVITRTIGEWRTNELRGDVNDRAKKIALPEQVNFPYVGEDSFIELQFKADASDNVVATAIGTAAALDVWQLPVTVYVI